MTVQASVRVRRRQYEFREYLQQHDRYEEQVRQTQKLESLGVLAGGIAHDFNNILTGILGNASLAVEILPDGHAARPLVEDVISASERAAGLTRQMLAYAGKGQFVVRPVDLSDVVRNLSDFFRASVPKRVELSLQLAPGLPAIEADTSQLQQIVMNLVMNAAEAIPEGRRGKVEVITGIKELEPSAEAANFLGASPEDGAYTFLRITDDGIGMDEQTRARIFDPFFTTKFMGRGLGLAAVQGIVRAHRGALTVESIPQKGTTFTIFFPASEAKPVLVSEPESAVSRVKRQTILIVDDEEIVRRTAAAILEKQGYSVITAENGKVALHIFRRFSEEIGVLLLDVTMPVMDAEETFRELKALRPDVKVILSSGYNETEALRRFTHGGQAGFIQKPYTSTRLLEKIRATLETAGRATGVSL
jgi:nitrogen-specific signal transduction histidine kinase/ActR/RegA family two-component response regulator